jgi:hypothetical protein
VLAKAKTKIGSEIIPEFLGYPFVLGIGFGKTIVWLMLV